MGSTGENAAPSFVKKPQLRQEDDGNRLVFECKLAGSPKPEVTWFREDVKIQNDSRTTFKVNFTYIFLFLRAVSKNTVCVGLPLLFLFAEMGMDKVFNKQRQLKESMQDFKNFIY